MKKQIIYLGIGAVIIIILLIISVSSGPRDSANQEPNENSTSTVPQQEEGTPTTGTGNPTPTKPTTSNPPKNQSITITTPVAGAQFVTNKNNLIKWSKEPGITGGIYLVDASTGVTAGWITPTITAHQTSYTWDTRDVALSRTNSARKNISAGRYFIKIKLDKPVADIQSAEFSIVYPSQVPTIKYEATLQNQTLSPKTLIVNKGETITIKNMDSVSHKIIPSGFGSVTTLAPGGYMLIETANMTAGVYEYYSENYPTAKLTLTVK